MQCIHCGYQLTAFDVKCPRCGKSASDPVEPRQNAQAVPPTPPPFTPAGPPPTPYQRPGYMPPLPVSNPDDQPSTGFAILGFLFPIIGLIIYLVTMSSTPRKASSALKGAAWGFGSGLAVVGILYMLGSQVKNDFASAQAQIDAANKTTAVQPPPGVVMPAQGNLTAVEYQYVQHIQNIDERIGSAFELLDKENVTVTTGNIEPTKNEVAAIYQTHQSVTTPPTLFNLTHAYYMQALNNLNNSMIMWQTARASGSQIQMQEAFDKVESGLQSLDQAEAEYTRVLKSRNAI